MRLIDMQTDSFLIPRPRLHSVQRGKKWYLALHCHLKPSVPRVVLDFNHNARSAYLSRPSLISTLSGKTWLSCWLCYNRRVFWRQFSALRSWTLPNF